MCSVSGFKGPWMSWSHSLGNILTAGRYCVCSKVKVLMHRQKTHCVGFAWGELALFTASGMGLCSGAVMNTVLMHRHFLLLLSMPYIEPKPFLLFVLPLWWGSFGCMGGSEGMQPSQLTLADQKDIPDHMKSCSVYKLGGGGKRRRDIWVYDVCLPRSTLHVVGPCSSGDGWTPVCTWEVLNQFLSLFLFACVHGFWCPY